MLQEASEMLVSPPSGAPAGDAPKRRSGRPKGSKNKVSAEQRETIIREGQPISFLCKVLAGRVLRCAAVEGSAKKVKMTATLEMRMRAAEILARKVLPDLR